MTTPSQQPDAKPVGGTAGPVRPARRRARLWLFRLLAVFGLPLLLLGVGECGLRLVGFGYDPSFFVPIEGRAAWMGNPKFGWRFFPPAIARIPAAFALPREKPPGTLRVFVLGSSAAMGFPSPAFSLARFLEAMLRARYPSLKVEVINTAMVAINSHAVLPIARDVAEQSPDVVVVYEGNNEVVGPYGAGTVFGPFTPSLAAIRTGLWLKTWRVGQAIERIGLLGRRSADSATVWRGMEFFLEQRVAASDPRLAAVGEHFRANLREIRDLSAAAGAAVLLCTAGVNLRDCPPFASLHADGLSGERLSAWQQAVVRGAAAETAGDSAAALKAYGDALAIDGAYAELCFRMGRAALAAGDRAAAKAHFEAARDLDALRFRTDSKLNAVIRAVAAESPTRATLVDVEAALASDPACRDGLPGDELFLEHCHLNVRGNWRAAAAIFAAVEPIARRMAGGAAGAPAGAKADAAGAAEPPAFDDCLARLGFGTLEELTIQEELVELLSNPPFTNQLDQAVRMKAVRARQEGLRKQLERLAGSGRERYEHALKSSPDDAEIHRNFGAYLMRTGQPAAALEQIEAAVRLLPYDARLMIEQGGAEAALGQNDRAAAAYRRAQAAPNAAGSYLADAAFNLGVVCERLNRPDEAEREYERALSINRRKVGAWTNLGLLRGKRGRAAAAAAALREAITIQPTQAIGYVNLGVVHFNAGDYSAAASALRDGLKQVPGELTMELLLAESLVRSGQVAAGVAEFRRAVGLAPQSAEANFGLGAALLKAGDSAGAIGPLREALRLRPDYGAARTALEKAEFEASHGRGGG
ncbi:MAG: tetratricopeptide repeat protein [Phycisphaerae bacterium]